MIHSTKTKTKSKGKPPGDLQISQVSAKGACQTVKLGPRQIQKMESASTSTHPIPQSSAHIIVFLGWQLFSTLMVK